MVTPHWRTREFKYWPFPPWVFPSSLSTPGAASPSRNPASVSSMTSCSLHRRREDRRLRTASIIRHNNVNNNFNNNNDYNIDDDNNNNQLIRTLISSVNKDRPTLIMWWMSRTCWSLWISGKPCLLCLLSSQYLCILIITCCLSLTDRWLAMFTKLSKEEWWII